MAFAYAVFAQFLSLEVAALLEKKGSSFFTGLLVSRQGSQALRLQEAKFGVPQFHDSRASYIQHSKFPGSKIPWTKGSIF